MPPFGAVSDEHIFGGVVACVVDLDDRDVSGSHG